MDSKKNELLARKIKDFLEKRSLGLDTRIFFNNTCYDWDSKKKEFVLLQNMKASHYFEGANDDTVCMTFEGDFYSIINRHFGDATADAFSEMLEEEGFYFEFYNAWNLSLYKI